MKKPSKEIEFTFTTEQVDHLEAIFRIKKYINIFDIEKLSAIGNYPEDKVQDWFTNRRKNLGIRINNFVRN